MPSPLSGFSRITLSAPTARVDLSVASAVPVATVLPLLLRQLEPAGAISDGWSLHRLDGRPLDVGGTLDANGVRDGDVLVVQPVDSALDPPVFDDVVELVGREAVDARWTAGDRRTLSAVVGSVAALLTVAAMVYAPSPHLLVASLAGAAALGLLLIGLALARLVGDAPAGALTAGLAGPFAVAAGALSVDATAARLLVGCAALLLVAAVLPAVGSDAVAGGYAVLAALTGTFGVVVLVDGQATLRAAAVVAPLAVAVTTALAPVALRAAHVPRPRIALEGEDGIAGDADTNSAADFDQTAVLARVAAARVLLTGMTAGAGVAVLPCVAILAASGSTAGRALAVVVALLALLRSRLYGARSHVLATSAAGIASLATVAVTTLVTGADASLVAAAAGLTALASLAVGATAARGHPTPRPRRAMDVIEALALVATVPLVLWVCGAYAAVRHLAG